MGRAFKLEVSAQGLAKLTFDLEAEKVNKFSEAVVSELSSILPELAKRTDIKIMTIESAKENVFIAGADIAELAKITTAPEAEAKARAGQEIFNQLEKLPFPTVAVIDGACLGGGLELALACTYRIATDNEKTSLGCPEVNLGIIPGWGGTQRLPRLIGLSQSLPMILGGKPVNGGKAFKIKLTDALAAKEFVQEKTTEFLELCLTPSGQKKILQHRAKHDLLTMLLERNPLGRYFLYKMAEADLRQKTRGNFPAPLRALALLRKTFRKVAIKQGLSQEAKAFAELAPTRVSKNLIQLFFTGEELKKDKGTSAEVVPGEINSAGLAGAGVMGGGIAWLFSYNNIPVRLKDLKWDAVGKGFAAAMAIYQQLKKIKKITDGQINLKMHHLAGAVDYSGWQNLDLAVEAIVENIEIKKLLLLELEEKVKPDAIICSNTSSLSINALAKALKHPERFVGLHFFNPVNRMPLVEVIPGEKTSAQTIATVFTLAKKLKKTPILVQDCPGFLVNRLLLPYLNEAVNLLQAGADFTRVDRLIQGFGLPMGPFTLADEVGLDICFHVMGILAAGYAPRMQTNQLLTQLYKEDKLLGKKAKQGFYLYSGKEKKPNPLISRRVSARQMKQAFSDQEIVERCIFLMINEASRCLEEKIVPKAAYLDMALILGAGFPPWRGGLLRYADEIGLPKILAALNRFAEQSGPSFKPARLLMEMAGNKQTFYNY